MAMPCLDLDIQRRTQIGPNDDKAHFSALLTASSLFIACGHMHSEWGEILGGSQLGMHVGLPFHSIRAGGED